MKLEQFIAEVTSAVENRFPTGNVLIQNAQTKNGPFYGLSVFFNDEVTAECINLMPYYERYKSTSHIEPLIEMICDTVIERRPNSTHQNIKTFESKWESVCNNVVVTLVGQKVSKQLLTACPYIPVANDLAFVYKIKVDANCWVSVTNLHLSKWNVTLEELHRIAMENTEKLFPSTSRSMASYLAHLNDVEEELLAPALKCQFIMSNHLNVFGAVSIFTGTKLKTLAEKVNEDIIIIPSSVHEVLAIPSSLCSAEEATKMVLEVNETLDPKELLSDHAYIYKKDKGMIVAA